MTAIFQYYSNEIHSSTPLGYVSLQEFLHSHKHPKPDVIELFEKIKQCTDNGDAQGKAKLKEKLYAFTPCVRVKKDGKRRYSDIVAFTGILVLDFDKIDNASDINEFLFSQYFEVIAAWLSPSRKGVKAFVKIPIVQSIDEFKSYYYGIAEEMDQYNGFDPSGQNAVLPLYLSYDSELLFRNDAETWTKKGLKINDFTSTSTVQRLPDNYKPSGDDERRILNMIKKGMDKIVDNGHPQLRSLCLSIGGYIANNYISEAVALGEINQLIQTHGYLKKGVKGYQQTAKWAINIGKNKPLTLSKNE